MESSPKIAVNLIRTFEKLLCKGDSYVGSVVGFAFKNIVYFLYLFLALTLPTLPDFLIHRVDKCLVDGHTLLSEAAGIVDGDVMQLRVRRPVLIQDQ